MTKNHFFKIVLLGLTLYLVANQLAGFVSRILEFFIGLTPLPGIVSSVVEVVSQIGTLLVLAFLAHMIYQSKYNDEKWVSSFTLIQLFVFFGLVIMNSVWNVVGYGASFSAGFEFRFWMIRGVLFNLAIFILLLIITTNLKNSNSTKTSTQVRYSTPNDVQKSTRKPRARASTESSASESLAKRTSTSTRTTPPDLPS